MITEVRIYTINGGMLDSWVDFFTHRMLPAMTKHGITAHNAWVNRPQNEFVWVRSYADPETLAAYMDSEERRSNADGVGKHLAKTEIRAVERVL